MRNYWLTQDLLGAVGWGYMLLWLLALALVAWLPKSPLIKGILIVGVLCFGAILPYKAVKEYRVEQQAAEEYKQRYAKAKAIFDERCKGAGEEINRVIPAVRGVVWMKWRPAGLPQGQSTLDDPYGKDCSMEGCILQLLRGDGLSSEYDSKKLPAINGYEFVETIDPRDGIRYRYTGTLRNQGEVSRREFSRHVEATGEGSERDGSFLQLNRIPIDEFSAAYGILWSNISSPEDRSYWIAGGEVKVLNLRSGEIIASSRGYLMDRGLGSTTGARDPWGWAGRYGPRCPQSREKTVNFVIKVLKPKQGN